MAEVRELASNHWPEILMAAGIEKDRLRNKHGPCPVCGGTDRFRFDDLEGTGSYFCGNPHHGAGDGFKLLMTYKECTFAEAAKFVRDVLGERPVEAVKHTPQPSPKRDEAKIRASLNKVAQACCRVMPGDTVCATSRELVAWIYQRFRGPLNFIRISAITKNAKREMKNGWSRSGSIRP